MQEDSLKVQIWDTYVKDEGGNVLHFDIVVPKSIKDHKVVFGYGKKYLETIGKKRLDLDTDVCQFCHLEIPSDEMSENINNQGYSIIEMDTIPADLPVDPSRTEMIMYLRAHFKEYRFKNFKGISKEEVQNFVNKSVH